MNIILIGYRGTGKSTVGKILAERLDMKLSGIDDLIVEKEGMSISDTVGEFGWEYFRDVESEAVEELSGKDNCVIDTGGGVILRGKNVDTLKKNGIVFLLKADVQTISERIKDSVLRPSLTGGKSYIDEIEDVLEERTPKYTAAADYVIDTDNRSPEEVADTIIGILNEKK